MDEDGAQEVVSQLEGKRVGGWGLLQIAGCTGLTAYAVWAFILMPGFRKVPLKLQVPYMPASAKQVANVMKQLQGRSGKMVDLGSGDGRIVLEAAKRGFRPAVGYELNPWLVRLSYFYAWRAHYTGQVSYLRQDLWKVRLNDCGNVSVFLAPSVLQLLESKLLAELPDDARVVAGRYPFPTWTPSNIIGEGIDRAWAYDISVVRQAAADKPRETGV